MANTYYFCHCLVVISLVISIDMLQLVITTLFYQFNAFILLILPYYPHGLKIDLF